MSFDVIETLEMYRHVAGVIKRFVDEETSTIRAFMARNIF